MRLLIVGMMSWAAMLHWWAQHSAASEDAGYDQAHWDPIHFKPAIETATDDQCLACHQEVLEPSVLETSPAGVKASEALAWYQTLGTYEGEQDTFHRRHLTGDYAQKVMDLKCNTCHQGNDPREETANSHATGDATLTQRKQVDPKICLMCHGQFPYEVMTGLTGPWTESGRVVRQQLHGLPCGVPHRAPPGQLPQARGDRERGYRRRRRLLRLPRWTVLVPDRLSLPASRMAGHGAAGAGLGQRPSDRVAGRVF